MARVFIGSALMIVGLSAAFVACEPAKEESLSDTAEVEASSEQLSSFDNSIKAIGRVENVVAMIKDPNVTALDPIAERLRQAVAAGNCQVNYSKQQLSALESLSILTISGSSCPMTANYKKRVIKNGRVTIAISFQILDSELAKLNDIYSLSVSGDGRYDSDVENESIQFTLQGQALSQSKGQIDIGIVHVSRQNSESGHVTQNGQQVIGFQFQQYKITLRAGFRVVNNKDYGTYTLNGKPITQAEYLGFVQPLRIVFN